MHKGTNPYTSIAAIRFLLHRLNMKSNNHHPPEAFNQFHVLLSHTPSYPHESIVDEDLNRWTTVTANLFLAAGRIRLSDYGPSVEERAMLYWEAYDRVDKGGPRKRA